MYFQGDFRIQLFRNERYQILDAWFQARYLRKIGTEYFASKTFGKPTLDDIELESCFLNVFLATNLHVHGTGS